MRHVAVILSVAAVIMLAGASFAYLYQPDFDFSLEDRGGSAEVSVSGTLPSEIRYSVLSGTDTPERIYLYLDQKYPGKMVSYRTQEQTMNSLKGLLSSRGYDAVEIIDAERLAQLCSDPSAAADSGIVMASGSIPEPAYPTDSENGLVTWLSNGGTLYWSGPDMGRFRAVLKNDDVDTGNGYFGDDVNYSKDKDCLVSEVSEMARVMGFAGCHAEYGLRSDYPGSTVIGLSGDYSSLSVVSVSSGRMFVLGNLLNSLHVEDFYTFADMMVCGIVENTAVKDSGIFHKGYGKCSFTIEGTDPGDAVYVSAGKTVSVCGKLFVM